MRLLNTEILFNPYNWIIIVLMLMFGLFLVALVSPQDS